MLDEISLMLNGAVILICLLVIYDTCKISKALNGHFSHMRWGYIFAITLVFAISIRIIIFMSCLGNFKDLVAILTALMIIFWLGLYYFIHWLRISIDGLMKGK